MEASKLTTLAAGLLAGALSCSSTRPVTPLSLVYIEAAAKNPEEQP